MLAQALQMVRAGKGREGMNSEPLIAFLNSDAGLALKGMLAVAFLDFATGSFAALRDGTFALDALAAFVRKHIFGRVAPIGLLLTVGFFSGETGQLFLVGAIAAAAAYVAESVASVWGNINPPKESDRITAAQAELTPGEKAAGMSTPLPEINPVPKD